ncbi:MotA/TolQ/ExbB proton channel family protein [Thioalkalivibrio thiocyanodenitrificans]|uniref:MotA/TolQ/ExbB proton channel family protein n=1 Tax=Thioalkalivibrio thiocyanodenitrificans TaxID=243063 RepID=UPI00037E2E58|nr:MotA/TolQ/ExbB proton channel family protein [Thioalkalivibrio thiocyanodenitrificans]
MMGENLWLGWWQDADWIVRGVFLLLIGLSLLSWSVILYKGVQLGRALRMERSAARQLALDAPHGAGESVAAGSASRRVHDALRTAALRGSGPREGLAETAAHGVRAQRTELENGLVILATIGNTAPFIGLLGTVWGIMHALQALGGTGTAVSMDLIAGPVAEALVATAAGLFTAIPAVVGYNLLLRRLRRILVLLEGNAACMLAGLNHEAPVPASTVSAVGHAAGRAG